MRQAGILVFAAACMTAAFALPVAAAETAGEVLAPQQVTPNSPPPEDSDDYRPPWADPDAKPPEPGIDDDPTPFNPSNVDGKSVLDND